MAMRWAAMAMTIVWLSACGGGNAPPATADLKVSTTNLNSDVIGKLAPALGQAGTIIVLEPRGAVALPIKAEPAIMDQAGYEFLPAFLIAQAGQQVQFRNSEDVLHNVRVTEIASQKPIFNVATPAFGNYEHEFDPGYYNVTCDIHTTMRASILVTASPYTATTAEDGSFTISNVQPGQYNLTIYAGQAAVVRSVEVKSTGTDLGVIE
jgi:plastocyanin